jgi:SAM-dependent methyltransferase
VESDKKESRNIANRLSDSPFFQELSKYYVFAPSAVLIRTAEAELLHSVNLIPPALDLCCGDGYFASLIHPSGFIAGCDKSEPALASANRRRIHKFLVCSDIGVRIPFVNSYFNTILSNSSLEHVKEIDATLKEICRVLKPGGKLYTTFGSNFAYSWWPCGEEAMKRYLQFQPVHNYFSIEEWSRRMSAAGLKIIKHEYYLSRKATRLLMFLDYHFSHAYNTADFTLMRPLLRLARMVPQKWMSWLWRSMLGNVQIGADRQGGGVLIIAERTEVA